MSSTSIGIPLMVSTAWPHWGQIILADILELSDKEREEMFDLAGKTRNEAPADLSSYLVENPHVRYALRKAKSMGAGEDEWLQMVADLEKRTREKALRAKEESAKRQ